MSFFLFCGSFFGQNDKKTVLNLIWDIIHIIEMMNLEKTRKIPCSICSKMISKNNMSAHKRICQEKTQNKEKIFVAPNDPHPQILNLQEQLESKSAETCALKSTLTNVSNAIKTWEESQKKNFNVDWESGLNEQTARRYKGVYEKYKKYITKHNLPINADSAHKYLSTVNGCSRKIARYALHYAFTTTGMGITLRKVRNVKLSKKKTYIDDQKLTNWLETVKNRKEYIAFHLMVHYLLRPSAVAGLKYDHFHFDSMELEVPDTKTGPDTKKILDSDKEFFKKICESKKPGEFLLEAGNSEKLYVRANTLQKRLSRIMRATGLGNDATTYLLRRSKFTILTKNIFNRTLKRVILRSGHRSTKVIKNAYLQDFKKN